VRKSPMNQKLKITKLVAEQLGLAVDEQSIDKLRQIFWSNPRLKKNGGLGLTEKGFESFCNAEIKHHRVAFEEPMFLTNSLLLWIDNNVDCPFYLTHKEIYLFGEKMAIQLILFSGNIQKLQRAQKRYAEIT